MTATTIEYRIQVTYPRRISDRAVERMVCELVTFASDRTGLGVDGWAVEVVDE